MDLLIIEAIKRVIHIRTEFLRDCRLFKQLCQFLKNPSVQRPAFFSSPVINVFEVINTILQSLMYGVFYKLFNLLVVGPVKFVIYIPVHSVL